MCGQLNVSLANPSEWGYNQCVGAASRTVDMEEVFLVERKLMQEIFKDCIGPILIRATGFW